jgi:hypothetical protein
MSELLDHSAVVAQIEEAVADLGDEHPRYLAFQRTIPSLLPLLGDVLVRWADELDDFGGARSRIADPIGGIPSVFSVSPELHQVVLAIGADGLRRLASGE